MNDLLSPKGQLAAWIDFYRAPGSAFDRREATGFEDEDCGSYGDPSSNAESMALRRAAAKFGLGLYLYEK